MQLSELEFTEVVDTSCRECSKPCDDTDDTDNDGNYLCDSCVLEQCSMCLNGPCEVETRSGDYICSDCYSGQCDDAYEYAKDSEQNEADWEGV